jgi:hypothetical protein
MSFYRPSWLCIIGAIFLLSHSSAWAWGRRGHSIVCQNAAYLAALDSKGAFLKNHSFDLGYYCNVPDIVWKNNPDTYKQEWYNHFMDMEIFDRAFKLSTVKNPFALDRAAFEKTFPLVNQKAGRAWWRIRELNEQLLGFANHLKNDILSLEARQALQAEWLLRAGIMGHYVGDLSQPMHLTENHDGEMTHQKGLHSFFEDKVINELFHKDGVSIETESMKVAMQIWKKQRKELEKKSVLELIEALSNDSFRVLPQLLLLDRQQGRDLKKVSHAYQPMAVKQLAMGSVYLGELYRRGLGFEFDDVKFYKFFSTPAFIPPGP